MTEEYVERQPLERYLTDPTWSRLLQEEFKKSYWLNLSHKVSELYKSPILVFPEERLIFNALNLVPLEKVKVVIIGQDPYYGIGQAHGLSFSVPEGVKAPPSLTNIKKEIVRSQGQTFPGTDLTYLAMQGVLLLNSVLTVEHTKPGSHAGYGWELFTDHVIDIVSKFPSFVVFLLWGNFGKSKRPLIDDSKNLILETSHPSPRSVYRGFEGCNHFALTNQALYEKGLQQITW